VHVDAKKLGDVQDVLGQEPAVSHHRKNAGLKLAQPSDHGGIFQGGRLQALDVVLTARALIGEADIFRPRPWRLSGT